MKLSSFFVISVCSLLIISCSNTKISSKKSIEAAVEVPDRWASITLKHGNKTEKWLESFNDPLMLKLIEEAKKNNLDIQLAAANMEKAWLLAKQSAVALEPVANVSLANTSSGQINNSAVSQNYNLGVTASWELDVWGRIRSGVSSAKASAQAAEADYIYAQHSISANIAKAYLKAVEANLQIEISKMNLSILRDIMRIVQVKYDNGLVSGQDMALTRTNLAVAKDNLIALEGSKRDALRSLELLLGRYPNAEIDVAKKLPDLPLAPPAGIPSEVLERRPDIVAAERRVASAFSATEQVKAAGLPKFSLTSTVSGSSKSLSNILNPVNVVWQLGANILAPLLDGGKSEADIEIATVEQKQAITNYVKTAISAFFEVESNLDLGVVLKNREIALKEVLNQSDKTYKIAKLRYKEGEIDLFDTLSIQQQTISAESNLLSMKRTQLEQRINMYLSLGGSW